RRGHARDGALVAPDALAAQARRESPHAIRRRAGRPRPCVAVRHQERVDHGRRDRPERTRRDRRDDSRDERVARVRVPPSAARGGDGMSDYIMLTKPRITLMVILTTAFGFHLANQGAINVALFVNTLIGTALSCAGAGALNM